MQNIAHKMDLFESVSEYTFDTKETIKEAKALFLKYERENFLLKGDFEDDIWGFYLHEKNELLCYLKFEMLISKDMKNMLKSWALFQLENKSPTTVQESLNVLKKVIVFTNEFKLENLENIIDWIESDIPKTQRRLAVSVMLNFIDFMQLPVSEEYYNELSLGIKSLSYNGGVRDLPNYNDVLMFQYILSDFSSKWTDEERLCYMPILIWWKLTTVIPMRISEFCSLERECIYIKDDKFFIKIPRKKQKITRKDHVEIINDIEINKDTFYLINEYIKLSKEYGETKTLISYKLYKEFVGTDSQNNATKYYSPKNFRRVLDKFYNEIINIKYGIDDIEQIKPNDTRHFAFCSMMLQGFNPLTIARMGGHRSVESQYHYQQHLDYFTQSHVYHLTKINKLRNSKDFRKEGSTMLLESAKINSLQPIENFDYLEPMEIGYCTDVNMDCESDYCWMCSKWYATKEQLKEHQKTLLDFSNLYQDRIKERLLTMERIRKNIGLDPTDNTYSNEEQEQLYRESKKLYGEINDLANINIKLDEINKED